jgi:hypothetical protein
MSSDYTIVFCLLKLDTLLNLYFLASTLPSFQCLEVPPPTRWITHAGN